MKRIGHPSASPARSRAVGRALLLTLLVGGCGGGDAGAGPDAALPIPDAGPTGPDAGADVDGRAVGAEDAGHSDGRGGVSPPPDGGGASRWTCAAMATEFERNRPGFGRVCVEAVTDQATWESISTPERPGSDLVRVTKFFLPVNDAAGIPPSFLDANSFTRLSRPDAPGGTLSQPWHLFFAAYFLPRVGTPMDAYLGPGRVAYGGYLAEIEVKGVGRVFGYYVEDDAFPCETHRRVHADMAKAFTLRPLYRAVFGPIPSPNKLPAGCEVPALVLR